MKKIILLALMLFSTSLFAQDWFSANLWKIQSGKLMPIKSTWGISVPTYSINDTIVFKRVNGQTVFSHDGVTFNAIPDSFASATGWTKTPGGSIYNTTVTDTLYIRASAGDTTGTAKNNFYGTSRFYGTTTLPASTTLITPNIGVATGTSLALGGATLWTNALALVGGVEFLLGSDKAFKIYGINRTANPSDGKYLTMFDQSIPGMRTNGYVTINGALGDPVPTSIAGNTMYMLGIQSDVGVSPTVVIKTSSGSLIKGYDPADNNVFDIDANGYITSARYKTANNYMYEYSATKMGFGNGLHVGGDFSIGSASSARELLLQGGSLVSLKIQANDATSDNKNWSWQTGSAVGDGILRLRALNDAFNNGINALIFQRTGISSVTMSAQNIYPLTDNTYYLGKNDDDTPLAYKGLILKDQAGTGKYYRLEVYNDTLRIVDLTD